MFFTWTMLNCAADCSRKNISFKIWFLLAFFFLPLNFEYFYYNWYGKTQLCRCSQQMQSLNFFHCSYFNYPFNLCENMLIYSVRACERQLCDWISQFFFIFPPIISTSILLLYMKKMSLTSLYLLDKWLKKVVPMWKVITQLLHHESTD